MLIDSYVLLIICIFILFFIIILFPKCLKVYQKRKEERLAVKSGIKEIDMMSGYEFEEYLKALFKRLGYKAVVTKKSGDYGADLVLKGGKRIVVQAKRYRKKNNVGINAVREVYGAKAYYEADEAWVVTNSYYTRQANELARKCEVKLLNRDKLQEFIVQVNK